MIVPSLLLNPQRRNQPGGTLSITEIIDHLLDGGTAGDVIGLDEKQTEAFYSMGHFLYSQRKYKDALKLFQLVIFHDHLNRRALKAFGICLYMLQRYEEAINPLGLAMLMDPSEPGPAFQIAKCMLAIGQIENSCVVLKKLIEEFGIFKEHENIVRNAEGLIFFIEAKK